MSTPGGEGEDEQLEIDEEMQLLDDRIQEIEDFNKRNFVVDKDFLLLFQDLYDRFDAEIMTAPYEEYS